MVQLNGKIDEQVQQLAGFASDDEVWEHAPTRTFYVGDAEGGDDEFRLIGTVAEYRQQLLDLIEAR